MGVKDVAFRTSRTKYKFFLRSGTRRVSVSYAYSAYAAVLRADSAMRMIVGVLFLCASLNLFRIYKRVHDRPVGYRARAYISVDASPIPREARIASQKEQGDSSLFSSLVDDVKVRAALKDIWRSESLAELERDFDTKNRTVNSVATLEHFLCTHDKYKERVDTYQSSRCLALCEKNESFARQYANTTCKYFNSRKFWDEMRKIVLQVFHFVANAL